MAYLHAVCYPLRMRKSYKNVRIRLDTHELLKKKGRRRYMMDDIADAVIEYFA